MNTEIPPHHPSLPPHFPPLSQTTAGPSYAGIPHFSLPVTSQSPPSYQFPPFDNKPSIYDRTGEVSVPPPVASTSKSSGRNGSNNTRPSDSVSSRMISCPPCKRSHLKCGRGTRPCNQCIKRGRVQDCLEGVPPEQAQLFLKAYHERAQSFMDVTSLSRSQPVTPVYENTPFFPQPGASLPRRPATYPPTTQPGHALSYPPLGQVDFSIAQAPMMFILGQDLRIGRASQASLRTLGYHPHEMVNHTLAYYMPILERVKWNNFTSKLFTTFTPAGRPLPVSVVELAKLNMNDLLAPVENMRSIAGHYHLRHHHKEPVSVRIELYFGAYFGATATDFNTFDKAIVVVKVTQTTGNTLLPSDGRPTGGTSIFPSVLMPPPPPPATNTGGSMSLPPSRQQAPSIQSGPSLAPLYRLPSLSDAFGGKLPPLPSEFDFGSGSKLPPIRTMEPSSLLPNGMTSRKRRSSSSGPQDFENLTLPPLLLYSDSGLPRPPSTRPRLDYLSQAQHSLPYQGEGHQGSSLSFSPSFRGGLPPLSRPVSRSRRPSYY